MSLFTIPQAEQVRLRDSHRDSLARLLRASPGWDRLTAVRGQATICEISQRLDELNDHLIEQARKKA
jgi:hypothetical protein